MNSQALTVDVSRLSALASQLSDLVAAQTVPSITFGELFNLYYEKHVKLRNKAPQNAKYFFQRHAVKYAQTPVNALTQRELQEWVDGIGDERGAIGAKRAIDMVSAIISWGIRRGYVNVYTNPCKMVDRVTPKARTRFAKPQDLARLADALRDEPPIWRDFFWLCLFTGARKGNMCSMRWADLDFDLGQWLIPDSKNGDDLVIALTQPAIALLQQRKLEAVEGNPWVFPGTGRSGHILDAKRAWARICRRAEIDGLRIHDLRRTLASYLAMQGASSYQIGKALGHRDPRSTAVYARLDLSGVRGEMEKVHHGWLVGCIKEMPSSPQPAKLSIATASDSDKPKPKNADAKIDPRQQVLIEARLIVAMQHGLSCKRQFYKKIGGKVPVNSQELDRILSEMVERGIVCRHRDETNLKNWQHWRYKLSENC